MSKTYGEVIELLSDKYPESLSESWDNCGLLIPPAKEGITGVVLTLSVTEGVVDKAIEAGANFMISHHPLWLGGLEKIDEATREGHLAKRLIENGIGLYVMHTNFDNHGEGMNYYLGKALNLTGLKPLDPLDENTHFKLEFYVPKENEREVFNALYALGGGTLEGYEKCSFASKGFGSFKGLETSNPYIGSPGEMTIVEEVKAEMIIPKEKAFEMIETLKSVHPYEVVAYYLNPIIFNEGKHGLGKVGMLPEGQRLSDFIKTVKKVFRVDYLKLTADLDDPFIEYVSICGGSGKHLLPQAIQKSSVYLTGDLTYHDFEKANYHQFPIIDIGHFNSERMGLMKWVEVLENMLEMEVLFFDEEGAYSISL